MFKHVMTWKKASLAICFLAIVQAFLIYLENAHRLWQVTHLTGTTQATITSQDFSFHNTAHYQYAVDGKVYQSGSAGWASDVRVGESLVIHYDPNQPWNNLLGNFSSPVPIGFLVKLVLVDIAALSIILLTYNARKKSSH